MQGGCRRRRLRRIEAGPVINHTAIELLLIEELVGRTPPFAVPGSVYYAPRKITYRAAAG